MASAAQDARASAIADKRVTDDVDTWRVRVKLLVLVEPSHPFACSDPQGPTYRLVEHEEPAEPNTEAGAKLQAEAWATRGVFVPGPHPQPAETFGTYYPPHRVQSVEIFIAY